MDEALDILDAEGYPHIFERHEACAAAARAGLEALGFPLFAEREHASKTVTSASLPDGVDWTSLNKEMRSRGLVLAGGQDWLAGKIMRIGHLGDVDVDDVVDAIEVIGEAANAIGFSADGAGAVEAARSAAGRVSREPQLAQAVTSGA
jgi:aspartate aminotransferase-like enzyme